jgi:hypothetical protein
VIIPQDGIHLLEIGCGEILNVKVTVNTIDEMEDHVTRMPRLASISLNIWIHVFPAIKASSQTLEATRQPPIEISIFSTSQISPKQSWELSLFIKKSAPSHTGSITRTKTSVSIRMIKLLLILTSNTR